MNKITHAAMLPLIGGMSVGAKMAYNSDPLWALSWDTFSKNESHFKHNFKNVPFYSLKEENDWQTFDYGLLKDVDVIHAVPVCAGLSMLNSSAKSDSSKARGSDAEQNKWMHYTTDIALDKIKPKVFIFENAPGLFQNIGSDMRIYLQEKAKQYGYSLSILFTDSLLHGLPQSRKRTFVFFWNTPKAPNFEWTKRDYIPYEKFFEDKDKNTNENKMLVSDVNTLQNDAFYKFAVHKLGKDWKSKIKYRTIGAWVRDENLLDEMKEFMISINDLKTVRVIDHWKFKFSQGKGVWDSTPLLYEDHTKAMISKNIGTVHPQEDRFLNIREMMQLMGLPDSYSLDTTETGKIVGGWNVLCQNVPCTTARDMFLYIGNVLNKNVESSESSVLYGNNISQKQWNAV